MQRWGSGYITDVEYTDGFYPAQTPHNLALTASVVGFEPPDLIRRFAYCELGCGRGGTSLVLAASYPHAEFHAVDFHPAHIAHAEARARAAGLTNLTFHERSFEDLMRPDMGALPMFDVVTLHGVWSWVAPNVQQAILDFLNRHVKPGGLVHLSYNAMPAWSVRLPLQRLLKEISLLWPGRSDHAAENAVTMLGRLADAKIIPPALHDGLKKMTEGAQRLSSSYLAHEYLNENWKPVYHADVARAFAEAKLTYAGASDLLRNFVNLGVTDEQRKLLAEIPIIELRETLRDYYFDHSFRQDVFVRGARRMTEARRDVVVSALRLTLVRPAPDRIEILGPAETLWQPNPEAYGIFLKALQRRPHSVSELLALRAPAHSLTPSELVGTLVGTGLAALYWEPGADARAACERFNRLIEADGDIPLSRTATLAVPCLGSGVTISAADFDLYMALKHRGSADPHELARRFVKRCKDEGGFPIINGKPVEDETEAHVAAASDYSAKLERIVPIWRLIGLVP